MQLSVSLRSQNTQCTQAPLHSCAILYTLLPCVKQSQEDSSENTILNVKFIFLERKNPQGFHCSPNSVIPNVNHYSLVVTCYPNPVITILSNCSPCYALLVILYCHPSDNNVFIISLSSNSSVIEVLSFQSYLTHLLIQCCIIEEVWRKKPRQTDFVVLWGKIAAHMLLFRLCSRRVDKRQAGSKIWGDICILHFFID